MSGGKGQVALYVLVGVIILLAVILALYLVNRQKTVVKEQTSALDENPELKAEVARMQERVDDCLAQVTRQVLDEASEYGLDVCSLEDAETALADEVSGSFSDCFFRFNTIDKLAITDDNPPLVTLSLGNERVVVNARYNVRGEYDDEAYTLSEYNAIVEPSPRDANAYSIALSCYGVRDASNSVSGTTGADDEINAPLPPGIPDVNVNELFDAECYYDAYAFEDQGIYTDLLIMPDGTRVVYVYDYNHLDDNGDPMTSQATLAPCTSTT